MMWKEETTMNRKWNCLSEQKELEDGNGCQGRRYAQNNIYFYENVHMKPMAMVQWNFVN